MVQDPRLTRRCISITLRTENQMVKDPCHPSRVAGTGFGGPRASGCRRASRREGGRGAEGGAWPISLIVDVLLLALLWLTGCISFYCSVLFLFDPGEKAGGVPRGGAQYVRLEHIQ